jgi:acyl-CoA thioesterase-1
VPTWFKPMMRLSLWCAAISVLSCFTAAQAQESLIVAIGDSNTAGAGVDPSEAYPAQLEYMLRQRGHPLRVANAGLSGDTFQGMLRRLHLSAPVGTRLVILQGGYNDYYIRRPGEAIASDLSIIIADLHQRGIQVVLCGFFRPDWDAFAQALVASTQSVFVDGSTCYDPSQRGPDGLHMNVAGHYLVATRLVPVIERLLAPVQTVRTPPAPPTRSMRTRPRPQQERRL